MVERLGDVAITGLGLALPLGLDNEEILSRIRRSEAAIGPLTRFEFGSARAAEVSAFDLRVLLNKPKNEKLMSQAVRLAMFAAHRAIANSGLDLRQVDRRRVAVHTGSGYTGICYDDFFPALSVAWKGGVERDLSYLGGRAAKLVDAYFSLRTLSNSGVGLISAEHDLHGPGCNFVQGECASAWALKAAAADLLEDRCDAAIAGGYDSLVAKGMYLAYRDAGLLSPSGRHAPFAAGRDGIVLGEGAAFFVLERLEDTTARGCRPLALLESAVSVGRVDGEEIFEDGLPAIGPAVQRMAAEGGSPDFVIARGIGGARPDAQEAALLSGLQGAGCSAVSFKALTGYLGAATAVTEIALAILCVRDGFLPAVLHVGEPDPTLPIAPRAHPAPVTSDRPRGLALSSGWSGQASALQFCVLVPPRHGAL